MKNRYLKVPLIVLLTGLILILFTELGLHAQSLGLNNATPNASSILDASSTTKGILIPRMSTAERDAIISPATGLLVYVTDKTIGFFYYDGSIWANMYSPSTCIIKRKTADEAVCGTAGACAQNTGTTLQNDDNLVIPLQANESYSIDGFLFMTAVTSTPDFKLGFTIPAGATMTIGYHGNYGDNNTNISSDVLTASGVAGSMINCSGTGLENPILISGCVIMGPNAGNLTLQWAQNTNSNANSTTVKANSYLRAMLIK